MRRIAPLDLEGRHRELDELATFCTSPATAGTYVWWRAEAWAGKTALMSWFVLHPPARVRLVSFFVTARYAAQNDRNAFTENLMEQLLALLGGEWPPDLGTSRYESNLLGLLTEAAETCGRRGEHLVLLVDGLDEDRGAHVGPDSHSIAALLPSTPPAGLRVVVTGRPHPPIPADVPPHHPLRDDTVVRTLEPSPRARAIRVEVERDLKRLLGAPDAERDLLGLVTAAGGGLSATDLAELTGESRWQVDENLRSATGRSFSVRDSHVHPDGPDVYLLAHEEIQTTALEMLGPDRLAEYRRRLHVWAERYRAARWPLTTPDYLLRGYFHTLSATGDLPRMVALATDPHRQNRMLDLSGGDAVALSEISTTQDAIAAADHPDLCAMVRLAIHRDHLSNRNSTIPAGLPAVWATLGHHNRAESIANSIPDPVQRTEALTSVATATAASGDRDRAARLLDDAEQTAHTITDDPGLRASALARVAGAAAKAGEVDRAERLAQTVSDRPNSHVDALVRMAEAAAGTGDLARAEHIAHTIGHLPHPANALAQVTAAMAEAGAVDRAERIAHTIAGDRYWHAKALARMAGALATAGDLDRAERVAYTITDCPDPHARADALARVARVAAEAGEPRRAARLLDDAEQLAHSITEPHNQANALGLVAEALVKAGDVDGAERIANAVTYPPHRTKALARLAGVVAETGDVDRAERIAHEITDYDPYRKAEALAGVAGVVAEAGESGRAARLLDDAERIARTGGHHRSPLEALARAAGMVARAGEVDRAEHIAGTITSTHWQANALARIAGAVAEAGEVDRAERIADAITDDDVHWKVEALTRVAESAARAGDVDRAERIARTIDHGSSPVNVMARVAGAVAETGDFDRAEHIATVRTDHDWRAEALARVAESVARAGDLDRAEHVAEPVTDRYWRAKALAGVAGVVAEAGEPGRAARLLDDAEQIAHAVTEPYNRVNVLAGIAGAAAKAGQSERAARLLDDAEHLARTIAHTYSRASAQARIAAAAAKGGRFERAVRIARTTTVDRAHRAAALVAVAQESAVPNRARVVAEVLTLADWQLSVDVLVELVPEALEVVMTELAAVSGRPAAV